MNTLRLLLAAALAASITTAPAAVLTNPLQGERAPETRNVGPWRVEILKAIYGPRGSGGVDVTYHLQGRINSGERAILVANSLGADPAPGYPKALWVTYRIGNANFRVVAEEGTVITFGSGGRAY